MVIGNVDSSVKQAGTFGLLGVQSKFGSHNGTEVGGFTCMLQQVLTVRRTVFHLSDDADKFGMQAVDAEVDSGAFSRFDDFVFHLFLHFCHHFFDTFRVDTSFGYPLV